MCTHSCVIINNKCYLFNMYFFFTDHGKLLGGYQFRSTLDVNNANYMDTGY
jgi:hypothetical protein